MPDSAGLLLQGGWVWTGSETNLPPLACPSPTNTGLLADTAVYCQHGRVAQLGSLAELRAQHPEANVVGSPTALILPGLINAHHHGRGVDPVLLGSADNCLEAWLADRAGEPLVDPYLDTLWAAGNLLARGVTTIVHFVLTPDPPQALPHAEARLRAWRDAGIRVAFGLDVRQQRVLAYEEEAALLANLPPDLAAAAAENEANRRPLGAEEYLTLFDELSARHTDDVTRFFLAPAGPQWVTNRTLDLVAEHSRVHGTRVHTHALETPYQREASKRIYGRTAVEHLRELGLLTPRTSLVHAVWVSEADIELLAASGTNVIHNPGANLRLSSGIAPVPALLRAGVNVALGTDGFTLSHDDLLAEARLAYHLHRWPGRAGDGPTGRQIVHAMTAGAALTTPFEDNLGTLRIGAPADITVIDLEAATQPFMVPGVDPLDALLQRVDGSHVLTTVVAGRVVAENGAPSNIDMKALAAELASTAVGRNRVLSSAMAVATKKHYQGRWNPSLVTTHWPHNGK